MKRIVVSVVVMGLWMGMACAQEQSWKMLGSVIVEKNNPASPVWYVKVDPNSILQLTPYVQAKIWGDYSASPMCHPSPGQCDWHVLHSFETWRFNCKGGMELVSSEFVFANTESGLNMLMPGALYPIQKDSIYDIAQRELCKKQ